MQLTLSEHCPGANGNLNWLGHSRYHTILVCMNPLNTCSYQRVRHISSTTVPVSLDLSDPPAVGKKMKAIWDCLQQPAALKNEWHQH